MWAWNDLGPHELADTWVGWGLVSEDPTRSHQPLGVVLVVGQISAGVHCKVWY